MVAIRRLRKRYEAGQVSAEDARAEWRGAKAVMGARKKMADLRVADSRERVRRAAERLATVKGVTVDELLG